MDDKNCQKTFRVTQITELNQFLYLKNKIWNKIWVFSKKYELLQLPKSCPIYSNWSKHLDNPVVKKSFETILKNTVNT